MGDNSEKKKIRVCYVFMRNPYMKFQDSSFNGLKVTVGTKKCDPLTHAPTHDPKAICPINFFKVWGIIIVKVSLILTQYHSDIKIKINSKLQYFSGFHCQFIQGHRRGMIIRNRSVWPTLFLLNVFTALKGTHLYIFICCTKKFLLILI